MMTVWSTHFIVHNLNRNLPELPDCKPCSFNPNTLNYQFEHRHSHLNPSDVTVEHVKGLVNFKISWITG